MKLKFRTMLTAAVSLLALIPSLTGRTQATPATPTRTILAVHDGGLYAQVSDALGRPVSSGVVSFEVGGGASLGSVAVGADGRAVMPLSSVPGQTRVAALYGPVGSGFAGSRSASALVSADVTGIPDFSITAAPSSLSVAQGSYTTTVLTVTPINNFSESVTLSCSGLPGQATCNFTPVIGSTAPTGTGTQAQPFTSTLQISTEAASGAAAPPDFGLPGRRLETAFAVALPGLIALAGLTRRRPLLSVVGLLLLSAGMLGLSGCSQRYGYLKHPPSVAEGTPLGTYMVTIAASGNSGSSVTNHNISLTLTVTKP